MLRNALIVIVACACIFALTFILDFKGTPQGAHPESGQEQTATSPYPAPHATITLLDGQTRDLESFRGKTVLLHFWATWCAPCVEELPALTAFAVRNKDRVTLIALSVDENKSTISSFLKKYRLDSAAETGSVYFGWDEGKTLAHDIFQSVQYPETFVIDPAGNITEKMIGAVDWLSPQTIEIIGIN